MKETTSIRVTKEFLLELERKKLELHEQGKINFPTTNEEVLRMAIKRLK